jgi:hypothetical protein
MCYRDKVSSPASNRKEDTMSLAAVRIERIRCVEPQDSVTDEVKMQQDGHQVWPGTGDDDHSISAGDEVPIEVILTFRDSTRITL